MGRTSLKRLKKDLRMGRLKDIDNFILAKLPLSLSIMLAEKFGLVRDEYKAGETVASMDSGDLIELAADFKNGDKKMEYRNIWEYWQYGDKIWYSRRYDDDFGGTLSLGIPCDVLFECPPLWKRYDHIYRLATKAECGMKR